MSDAPPDIPMVWPNSQLLCGCDVERPNLHLLLTDSRLLLGVLHGVTGATALRLEMLMTGKPVSNGSGNGNGHAAPKPERNIRLIVTLYPTCSTTRETLEHLLQLQIRHPSLELRLTTCSPLVKPESVLCCFGEAGEPPILLMGSSASLEDIKDEPVHLTIAFRPEPTLAADWVNWFDARWLQAVPLTEARTAIPYLVLPEGTAEAAEQWSAYERLCDEGAKNPSLLIEVDGETGKVAAPTINGEPQKTVSEQQELPTVSPVYRPLSQLFQKGHLVSVDKTTRLPPLEVPVKPQWFGLEKLKQIGSVKRQVSYHISALTKDELKQLENRRKKTGELLDLFSFSLADGQRWMPSTAESLFEQERRRINMEAKGYLDKLIGGQLEQFMEGRRDSIHVDANNMYRDLFPNRDLPKAALDEMMAAIKNRLEEAQKGTFLPRISFSRVGLPLPDNADWKSQLGSALHLLLSIARFPRKAAQNSIYFARGMNTKPLEILKAMNILGDPFVIAHEKGDSEGKAVDELAQIDKIAESDATDEAKCLSLLKLIRGESVPQE